MPGIFSDRISDVPRSFIREILKTTVNPDVISFAGGLPNRELFPVEEIKDACAKVLDESGRDALQYSTSEGYLPLREWIAERYASRMGLVVDPETILITSGSQQALDLIGKTFVNTGDHVAIEEPGYLGAIQAFALYRPAFEPLPLHFEGVDIDRLRALVQHHEVKLFYAVPNFQNPSGISHSDANRDEVAAALSSRDTLLIEDDPYGELQFSGSQRKSYRTRIPGQTILLGSFSKIFVPAFRIGWLAAPSALTSQLLISKQASDLHTNYFAQRVLHRYLIDNDIDEHIVRIRRRYLSQKEAMISAIGRDFPPGVEYSNPDGGMFLWAILPEGISARRLFDTAIAHNVAFVPGDPFYVNKPDMNTMRLNFSCVDETSIVKGVSVLGGILEDTLRRQQPRNRRTPV